MEQGKNADKKLCCIVGAGDFDPALLPSCRKQYDLIAADGGFAPLQKAGILPDLCIGDYDSLGYIPKSRETLVLPVEKDETDLGAAALLARDRGYTKLLLYGVLGGSRFSHSLAATQTLIRLRKAGLQCMIVDSSCMILPLIKETLSFPDGLSGHVSVFAVSDQAIVTMDGLHYPLQHSQLFSDYPLGVSNSFSGLAGKIEVEEGNVLVVLEGDARKFGKILFSF